MRVQLFVTVLLLVVVGARADEASIPSGEGAPAPDAVTPFSAWVRAERVPILVAPSREATVIGLLRRGDTVIVRACVPSCVDDDGWASIEPMGFIRTAQIATGERDADASARATDATFVYGRVARERTSVHARPDGDAPRIDVVRRGDELAFRADEGASTPGWRARVRGGFVRAADVHPLAPSIFEGVHAPSGPIAFTRRATSLRAEDGGVRALAKHVALTLVAPSSAAGSGWVEVEGGTVARRHVRIARSRARPSGIAVDARWVHVDLGEQVLTAYEGDRWVFATLVSTGDDAHPTRTGHFRVFRKSIHDDMHGPPGDPYVADEVPHVMYFHEGIALHGAYWHDVFGTQVSHGCVNLSPRDAAWLFAWAPPPLPEGWHALFPTSARLPTLQVIVEPR